MILVNNLTMKKIKINKNMSGIYYTKRQLLYFESRQDILSYDDMLSLFMGFVRLIKKSTEIEVENKYLLEINKLKRKLEKFEKY